MPNYEFVCNSCKKTFTNALTFAEHDAKTTACPDCGSHDVDQRWSTFSAVTSKKSARTCVGARRASASRIFPSVLSESTAARI